MNIKVTIIKILFINSNEMKRTRFLVKLLLKPLLKLHFITRKMYSIHFSRYIRFITWKMYWIAKPLFLPLQIVGNVVFYSFFCETFIFKAFLRIVFAIGGRLTTNLLHALCVFLCSPLFEPKWEPLEVPSVREIYFWRKIYQNTRNFYKFLQFV